MTRIRSPIMPWTALERTAFTAPGDDLFASWLWFDLLARAARPPGRVPAGLVVDGATLPLWCRARAGALLPAEGMTSPYSIAFRPAPTQPTALAATLAATLVRAVRGVVRLDALDPADPAIAAFECAAAETGLATHRFSHFSNWFMPVEGDFAHWLATRPGALRNTIKRRMKAAASLQFRSFGWTTSPPKHQPITLDDAIAGFTSVYAGSWKPPEPFAQINEHMMRSLAGAGVLRVGLLADQNGPLAAQYWAVSGQRAFLLKLAYLKSAASHSPGTVLTALMIQSLLAADPIAYLDFGRGDDPYKRDWVSLQQRRIGLLLINRRSAQGVAMLARLRLAALRRAYRPPTSSVSPAP
ncbi:MAG: GNAT family N-acetyltransferase [Acidiphilium sp.]